MSQPNPILVEVLREGVLESFHRGVICVVGENNQVIFSRGDVHQICYPRSAMKYFQVLPLIEAGGIQHFGLTSEEIAIMCGSHNAEPEHVRVVQSILKKIGCSEDDLKCGAQTPTSAEAAEQLRQLGEKPRAIHNNCSGKHAGMLALAVLLKDDISTYLRPSHRVQQRILEVCEQMYEFPQHKMVTALDGCSAPIFSIPVLHQAIGFRNLIHHNNMSQARSAACNVVIKAITDYPFMVAGSKRYCTDMMKITAPDVIGKTGAEGIFCMTFTKLKLGVCIKIDDGKMQPQYNVAQAILEKSNQFSSEILSSLHHYHQPDIKNFNKLVTGKMQTSSGLFDGLNL